MKTADLHFDKFPTTDDLIEAVLDQIFKDFAEGTQDPLAELLATIPRQQLLAFLPEQMLTADNE